MALRAFVASGSRLLAQQARSVVAVPRSSGRFYAAAAAGAEDEETDEVAEMFLESQAQFRALMEATKDVSVPLDGNPEAVTKYIETMEKIKADLGIKSYGEAVGEMLDNLKHETPTVREFLKSSLKLRSDLGIEYDETFESTLLKTLDKVEQKTGPLSFKEADSAGMTTLRAEMKTALGALGLDKPYETVAAELTRKDTEAFLAKLAADAKATLEAAKKAHKLDFLDVPLKEFKPSRDMPSLW